MKKMTRTQAFPLTTATTLIALGFLVITPGLAHAQEETRIYKSIAEDGSTVFTDQPAPDATEVKPAPLNVMDSPATQPTVVAVPRTPLPIPAIEEIPVALIDSVVIEHPLDDQTFVDPQEQILVEFSTAPASSLPVGLTANVWLDDTLVGAGSSYQMSVDVPERGTHQLQVQLVDEAGSVIVESDVIEIHVKQHVAGSAN